MTTQNWPDPKRPGVPLFPERDGWHVVTLWRSGRQVTGFWHARKQKWGSIDGVYTLTPKDAVNNTKYYAASLTITQIADMLAAERQWCADACRAMSFDNYYTKTQRDALEEAENAIRNLGDAP